MSDQNDLCYRMYFFITYKCLEVNLIYLTF